MSVIEFKVKKEIFEARKQKREKAFSEALQKAKQEISIYLSSPLDHQKKRAEDERSLLINTIVRSAFDLAVQDESVLVDYDLASRFLNELSRTCACADLEKGLTAWSIMMGRIKDGTYKDAHKEVENFFVKCLFQSKTEKSCAHWRRELVEFWDRRAAMKMPKDRSTIGAEKHWNYFTASLSWTDFIASLDLIKKAGPQGVDRNNYKLSDLSEKSQFLLQNLEEMAVSFLETYTKAVKISAESVITQQDNLFVAYEFFAEILNDPSHKPETHKQATSGLEDILDGHRCLRNNETVLDYLKIFFENVSETNKGRSMASVAASHLKIIENWKREVDVQKRQKDKRVKHRQDCLGTKIRIVQSPNLKSNKGPT